jgi:hypothetical protein
MQVATDGAGNSFTAVAASNSATLDQDTNEQKALTLSFIDATILTAQSKLVHFTVGGIEPDDTALVTFTDSKGATTTTTVAANGTATVDLSGLADGAITASMQVAIDAAGNSFLPVAASSSATLDQDKTEQAALSLAFVDTTILTAQSKLVHFTVGGLDPEDTAVVTFTDSNGGTTTATVNTNGTATVDLSSLADGTITASMQVATDAAGNSFLPVAASNSATLDQDKTEQAALSLAFVDTTILAAQSKLVHFTVGGLDPEDSAVVTFTDSQGGTTTATVTTNGTATVDLSSLAEGTITASMQVAADPAGNSFLPVAASNIAALDQDKTEQAALALSFIDTAILTAQSKLVHFSVSGLDPEDSAVVTFTDSLGGKTTATVTANGTATADLSGLADGAITASMQVATDAAGNTFAAVGASNTATLDPDTAEQTALALSFIDTTILTAQSKLVHFNVSGLDPEDGAVVTFTDSVGGKATATVTANGTATVDLSGLADGAITASMQVATDAAGNSFTAVAASNSAILDQDSNERPSLSFANTLVGAAGAKTVSFTVGGIDPTDDTAVITFTDQNGKTTTATMTANGTATADLSILADGPITASMVVTDTAGNTFSTNSSNSVALDLDLSEQAVLKVTLNGGSPIGAAVAGAAPFTVAGLEPDDNGTVTFSDGNAAHNITVNIVNGVPAAASANLSGFNDGSITATLHLDNDAAGNSFADVVTTATLDQDLGEQAALKLAVNGNSPTPIGAAVAGTVAFTVGGGSTPTIPGQ